MAASLRSDSGLPVSMLVRQAAAAATLMSSSRSSSVVPALAVGAEHSISVHPDDVIRRLTAEPTALPDRRVRLLCLGAADGPTEGTPLGCYLAEHDSEANDCRGSASWTPDPAKALAFEAAEPAMTCHRAQPKTRPMRPDGKPNRPLTVFAITLH
jgi:hypothetical protein